MSTATANLQTYADRDAWLAAREYIRIHAIGSTDTRGMSSVEMVIKSFAYYAGPLMLDTVLTTVLDANGSLRADNFNLDTAHGRTAARLKLAMMVGMVPLSPVLIGEAMRIRDLIGRVGRAEAARALLEPVFGRLTDVFLERCLAPTGSSPPVGVPRGSLEGASEVNSEVAARVDRRADAAREAA